MRTELVHFSLDAPPRAADAGASPGALDDGSVICAIEHMPDHVPLERLLNRLKGLFPSGGLYRVAFADLPPPPGGCCGGCGG